MSHSAFAGDDSVLAEVTAAPMQVVTPGVAMAQLCVETELNAIETAYVLMAEGEEHFREQIQKGWYMLSDAEDKKECIAAIAALSKLSLHRASCQAARALLGAESILLKEKPAKQE